MSSPLFSLEVQELRKSGNAHVIFVRWFTSIKDIKDQLHKIINCPPARMQLFHSSRSKHLSNQTTLHDLGIDQNGHILRLALTVTSNAQYLLIPSKDINLSQDCKEMLQDVHLGLRCGHKPAKTDMLDCTGGVYFMKAGTNRPCAVFKPNDEEQGMPNNPKGHAGNGEVGLRPFLRPGEGYIRETASYLLDYGNFCKVPPTSIVHCEHDTFHYPHNHLGEKPTFPKLGSLQKFVAATETFEDISPSKVGVLELQKIALLDMRLLNCDRNASNILLARKQVNLNRDKNHRSESLTSESEDGVEFDEVEFQDFLDQGDHDDIFFRGSSARDESVNKKISDTYDLIPIDHGYCLPTKLQIDEFDWAWYYTPHVAAPVEPEIKEYMESLDIDSLLSDLTEQIALPDDTIFLLRVTHQLLVEGIAAGLTLRDIASLIARVEEDTPSPLENAINSAEDNAVRAIEMRAERRTTRGAASPSFLKGVHNSPLRVNLHELSDNDNNMNYDCEAKGNHTYPSPLRPLDKVMTNAPQSKAPVKPIVYYAEDNRLPHRVVNSVLNLESMNNNNHITGEKRANSPSIVNFTQILQKKINKKNILNDNNKDNLNNAASENNNTAFNNINNDKQINNHNIINFPINSNDNTLRRQNAIDYSIDNNNGDNEVKGSEDTLMDTTTNLKVASDDYDFCIGKGYNVDKSISYDNDENAMNVPLSPESPTINHGISIGLAGPPKLSGYNYYYRQQPRYNQPRNGHPITSLKSLDASMLPSTTNNNFTQTLPGKLTTNNNNNEIHPLSVIGGSYNAGVYYDCTHVNTDIDCVTMPEPSRNTTEGNASDSSNSEIEHFIDKNQLKAFSHSTEASPRTTVPSESSIPLSVGRMQYNNNSSNNNIICKEFDNEELDDNELTDVEEEDHKLSKHGLLSPRRTASFKKYLKNQQHILLQHNQFLNHDNDTTITSKSVKYPQINHTKQDNTILPMSISLDSLPRVTSFGAFESPPLYDYNKNTERQLTYLRIERRKNIIMTNEFNKLRLIFIKDTLLSLITKEKRSKLRDGARSDTL